MVRLMLRKMALKDWFTACRKNALKDEFLDLTGPVPSSVADTLEISKQRVHQLVQDDALDAVSVTAPNGTITMTFVTENSLARYLAKRAPARRGGFTLRRDEKLA
jgi:hypothetical protein